MGRAIARTMGLMRGALFPCYLYPRHKIHERRASGIPLRHRKSREREMKLFQLYALE
jgi:hypothetical protein